MIFNCDLLSSHAINLNFRNRKVIKLYNLKKELLKWLLYRKLEIKPDC